MHATFIYDLNLTASLAPCTLALCCIDFAIAHEYTVYFHVAPMDYIWYLSLYRTLWPLVMRVLSHIGNVLIQVHQTNCSKIKIKIHGKFPNFVINYKFQNHSRWYRGWIRITLCSCRIYFDVRRLHEWILPMQKLICMRPTEQNRSGSNVLTYNLSRICCSGLIWKWEQKALTTNK